MTTDTIHTAIIDWAASRGILIDCQTSDAPPALLDARPLLTSEELFTYGSGVCLTIDALLLSGIHAKLGFWIPETGRKGTMCTFEEGDSEIGLEWLHSFASEIEMLSIVDQHTNAFLLQYVYGPTLDAWLEEEGISAKEVQHTEFCGEACQFDLGAWRFLEFSDAKGYDTTLGISGSGDAATFMQNDDAFLHFDVRAAGLKNSADLTAWLKKTAANKA